MKYHYTLPTYQGLKHQFFKNSFVQSVISNLDNINNNYVDILTKKLQKY